MITSSDTRDPSTDKSGALIRQLLEEAGHTVSGSAIVPDDPAALRAALEDGRARGAQVILITGGTGLARRDQVVETLRPLLDKELPGFGELFRMLSFEEIGPAAMLSRALAGSWQGVLVFALPGSSNAVRLAMTRLVLPEVGHAVKILSS